MQIIHQNISFKGHRSGNASGGSVDHTLLISNTVTSTQLRVYGFIEFIKNYIRHEDGSEYLGGTIAQICTNKSGCAHLVISEEAIWLKYAILLPKKNFK